jgi:lysyl-tRNA synthetase class II
MDQDRLDKWNKFLVAGLKLGNPVDFDTTNVLFLNKTNDGIEIDACGRVMEIMNLGNIIFLHIERTIMNFDKEPVIKLVQIVVSKKDAPEAHSLVKTYIQRGDIIGASGVVYTTNIGVKSIKAIKLCLLTKCFNWVGKVLNDDSLISDKEELYRKPYIRMNVDNTTRDAFFAKALLLKILRQHLDRNHQEMASSLLPACCE